MNILKPILASALLVGSGLFAQAEEGYNAVIVNMTDGSKMGIEIEETLQCCFTEDLRALEFRFVDVMESFNDAPLYFSVTYPRFKSLEMTADYSGISDTKADYFIRPELREGKIYISGMKNRTTIEVYTTDGKLLSSSTAEGDATIDLNRFGSGIFLVNINGTTYKFPVK